MLQMPRSRFACTGRTVLQMPVLQRTSPDRKNAAGSEAADEGRMAEELVLALRRVFAYVYHHGREAAPPHMIDGFLRREPGVERKICAVFRRIEARKPLAIFHQCLVE